MVKQLLIFITVLLLIGLVRTDLPVHCTKQQIVGKWKLQLTKFVTDKSSEMVSCGHTSPDNETTSWKAMQDNFESDQEYTVTLQDNNNVNSVLDSKSVQGNWTMIYDEGFEISLSNYKFFTFSKYQSTNMAYESVCDRTLVGWYHDTSSGKKGCLIGYKDGGNNQATQNVKQDKVVQPKSTSDDNKKQDEKQETTEKESDNKQTLQTTDDKEKQFISTGTSAYSPEPLLLQHDNDLLFSDGFILAQTEQGNHEKKNNKNQKSHLNKNKSHKKNLRKDESSLDLHKGFSQHEKVVERLNSVQKSWTAKVPEEFKDYNLGEMNQRAGRIRYKNKSSPFTISFAQTGKKETDGYENYSREDVSDLPKELSWESYLNDPIQQKDCGSCYAIATSEMLSARLKINHNEDVKISAQHSIDCNYYNQGCDGGYGYLTSKFFSEYEMVPENCHPYKGVNGQCSNSCDVSKLSKTYKVDSYGYIGGAYGKSSERLMMLEIQQNGPIVVSFEPAYDFMYYSSGIYHSVDAEEWLKDHESQPQWEKVDHSVLCYGWGEENGEKYWKILNSWGKNWGEDGHFRIRRGTDESHVESMGEAASPYVINKK